MFDLSSRSRRPSSDDRPHLFGIAPGVDFIDAFVEGFWDKTTSMSPEAIARCQIWVNTRRTQRRMRDVLAQHRNALLPKVRLVTELDREAILLGLPPGQPSLNNTLRLIPIITRIIRMSDDFGPQHGSYAMARSLTALLDEMDSEGVNLTSLEKLPIPDQSGHWDRSVQIIRAAKEYLDHGDGPPSIEARYRLMALALSDLWRTAPPKDPVIIAGSTGSRGPTRLLMHAVARLSHGAVVLPGVDPDMDEAMWAAVDQDESHPQHRFARICNEMGLASPSQIPGWTRRAPKNGARSKLVSLALCPAPVTHYWSARKDALPPVQQSTQGLTLLEAPSPRMESVAIALRLREAVESGTPSALITPDRILARHVTAALDRWHIYPDDSAGQPLALSTPGRLLLMLRDLRACPASDALIAILRSPLVCTGANRGAHLAWTQALELSLRKQGPVYPRERDLIAWAAEKDTATQAWATWIAHTLMSHRHPKEQTLQERLSALIQQAEALCAGPSQTGAGALWDEAAGREAWRVLDELSRASVDAESISHRDFQAVLTGVLQAANVRAQHSSHPLIHIWGTLEARVQGAELMILGGLNEGAWPAAQAADPWLNRSLRKATGLLLPDREVGLLAHDFQQALNGGEVWLTRATRSAETETVPSRWLHRLTNLMEGIDRGPEALRQMRERAAPYLQWAAEIDTPANVVPAQRPSPAPPLKARPRKLSVTQIKTLIRDPYAIYARHILGLKQMEPLRTIPDARKKGQVLHTCLETFISAGPVDDPVRGKEQLMQIGQQVLEREVPWPAVRQMWLAHLEQIAEPFVLSEIERQRRSRIGMLEVRGELALEELDFTLTGRADRIDMAEDGAALIYDYKTGRAPSKNEQLYFDKQLLLTTIMVERGAFHDLGARKVSAAAFLCLSRSAFGTVQAPSEPDTWTKFTSLIAQYDDPHQGYTPRRALWKEHSTSDYDTLSRYGEWDLTQAPVKVRLK